MRDAVISLDAKSWWEGYDAGFQGLANRPSPGSDALAFSSGYFEGKAHRDGFDLEGRRKVELLRRSR